MFKSLAIASIGALSALTIPAIASAQNQNSTNPISLNQNQTQFIQEVDKGMGTNFSSLVNTPGANQIIKSASLACGNIELQKKTIYAMGGNQADADYASSRFQTKFCGN